MKKIDISKNTLITLVSIVVIGLLLIFIYSYNQKTGDRTPQDESVSTSTELQQDNDSEETSEDPLQGNETDEGPTTTPLTENDLPELDMGDFYEKGDQNAGVSPSDTKETTNPTTVTDLIEEAEQVTQSETFDPEKIRSIIAAITEVLPILEKERDSAFESTTKESLTVVIDTLKRLETMLTGMLN